MSSVSFVSGNRSVGLNQFHLEWCPKYRKALLVGGVRAFIERNLMETAQKYNILIHAFEVASDHVHLFVSLPFNLSVSGAFQLFKGRSSYAVFRAFPQLRTILWGGHFWSPGKFGRSISNVKASTIQNYIKNHQTKELEQSIVEAKHEAAQAKLCTYF